MQVTDNRTDGGRKARRRGYTAMPRGWREAFAAGPVDEAGAYHWMVEAASWEACELDITVKRG